MEYHLAMEWNDRLRDARDRADRKNTEIAKYCKVADPTVNGWMTGEIKTIAAHNLLPACRLLGVSPFYIIYGEDAPGSVELVPDASVNAMEAIQLLALYAKADDAGRKAIMGAAVAAAGTPKNIRR